MNPCITNFHGMKVLLTAEIPTFPCTFSILLNMYVLRQWMCFRERSVRCLKQTINHLDRREPLNFTSKNFLFFTCTTVYIGKALHFFTPLSCPVTTELHVTLQRFTECVSHLMSWWKWLTVWSRERMVRSLFEPTAEARTCPKNEQCTGKSGCFCT